MIETFQADREFLVNPFIVADMFYGVSTGYSYDVMACKWLSPIGTTSTCQHS